MNILTFDIEEWFAYNQPERYPEFDKYLEAILDKLEERQLKATFFCVGEMGRLFPKVIRKIHSKGHEIGCHSNTHTWLNKMSKADCQEDTRKAVDCLQQCVGEKIISYRAPAFSIGERNKWAFEVLAENGIERDASVFPLARDFGGFPQFGKKTPCLVDYNGICIKEFPICTSFLMGKEFVYSGGGFFRFFPLWFVKREIKKADYSMCYFHIGDLLPERNGVLSKEAYEAYFKEKGTIQARYSRYFKSNYGKKNALNKLMSLIDTTDFFDLRQSDRQIDWNKVPVISLL